MVQWEASDLAGSSCFSSSLSPWETPAPQGWHLVALARSPGLEEEACGKCTASGVCRQDLV